MKKLQKKLQLLSLLLIAGLLFSSLTIPVKAYIQKQGTVNETVTLRQNADANSSQVLELTNGQAVTVNNETTAEDGTKWYQLFVNGTTLGYVPVSTVTISSSGTTGSNVTGQATTTVTVTEKIGTVTASTAVRVRADASTNSEQVASMNPNAQFTVLGEMTGTDGYVWYELNFDDNGTEVHGYVRSDLVEVKEVTREEEVPVENPSQTTPSEPTQSDAPYSVKSQVNAEGTTVWYLVDDATGEGREITSLLNPPKTKSNNGVLIGIIVVLVILVIAGSAAAAFFFIRWQDAENFINELRDKQMRAKKQANPNAKVGSEKKKESAKSGTFALPKAPVKEAPKAAALTQKEAPKATVPTQKEDPKPVAPSVQKEVSKSAAPIQKEIPKPTAPAEKEAVKPVSAPVQPEAPAQKEMPKPAAPAQKDILPKTKDIVNTTRNEIQNQNPFKAEPKKSEKAWKSKNFLTEDDDLDFDFLDMEEK